MDVAGEFMSTPAKKQKTSPKLFIKEIVLNNFKSYAGEQRVGPFHKSFSAVVGPNGSGKSNVIDAMLFVFGKRAKQMRLNKVSELIHNSTNNQNLNSASVCVHFQEIIDLNDETYKVVPESDLVIAREVFRDIQSSSKYYINGRQSTFEEVANVLKRKGIDLDNNRFLILQGEVEQISLMKPKAQGAHDEGFLEYLEDIIGTKKYLDKIDESLKQLQVLNAKRSGVVHMVKLVDKERANLEIEKNEAEDYMLKEFSLLKWKVKAVKFASDDNATKMEEIQKSVSGLEENLTSERERIEERKKTLEEVEILHNEYMKRQKELETLLQRCKDELRKVGREDDKHKEDLKHVKQKVKEMDDKTEMDLKEITEITRQSEESANLISKLKDNITKLQENSLEEEKMLEEIEKSSEVKTKTFRTEADKVNDDLEPWEEQLKNHQRELAVASNEKKLLFQKHEAARAAYLDAEKQWLDIKSRLVTKTSNIKDMRTELDKNKLESSEACKLKEDREKEQKTLTNLEQAARHKVTELTSCIETEMNHRSRFRAILQAKASNAIQGIYGRLGDLGAIDGKYDVAISTACPGLDYIIVETNAAAEACVNMLRENSLGVETFMKLDEQVKHMSRLKEKVSTPEGVPRLIDLIKVQDERMKLAFFAVTGNTIVADDMDQATRIAYGGNKGSWRIVTLDGSVIEKSRTMTGGGEKPRGGKMGTSIRATTSVSREAVSEAENEVTKISERLSNVNKQVSQVSKNYNDLQIKAANLKKELVNSQIEIQSLNLEHDDLSKQVDSLKDEAQPSKDELTRLGELTKIISEEEKEINRLTQGSKHLKEKLLELQSKIRNAEGGGLKIQKDKIKKIKNDINRMNTEINRHQIQIETGETRIKELRNEIEDSKKERERQNAQNENLLDTFKEIKQKAAEAQDDFKKTQELIDQHKEEFEKAKSNFEKLKKTVYELGASKNDAVDKLRDMKKMVEELEMKEKGYKKTLEDLNNTLSELMEQIKKDQVNPEKLQATLNDESSSKHSDLKRALEMVDLLEAQMKEMDPNLESVSNYRERVTIYNERVQELNLVTNERDEMKKQCDEWKKKRLEEFMAGFNTISLELKEMYQMITLGGDAELELVDSLDPFSEGVVFSVRPPKKSWKNISNLSGGEKTLSSLALVFALHHYKPAPLYVMDEIDAALDFKNVSIVGNYIKNCTKDAQFIIISLRNNMFELADRLVGIYKTENCTQSITIDPRGFVVC